MPYDPKNPPKDLKKKIKKLYPNAKEKNFRQFVYIFNSSIKAGDDESIAFAKAWGTLKNNKKLKKKKSFQEFDLLEGGLSDNDSLSEFDLKELLKGFKVELEHTKDPIKAIEIASDHLSEHPDYYTALKDMEDELESDALDKLVSLSYQLNNMNLIKESNFVSNLYFLEKMK